MKKFPMHKKYRGFSLVEMLVAMFVFSLVIGATSGIFTKAFVGYRAQKHLQSDIESAQFALNTMAKELRTATIANLSNGSNAAIEFLDYSQNTCFFYKRNSGATLTVETKKSPTNAVTDCNSNGYSVPAIIANNVSDGHFYITKSVKKEIGPPLVDPLVGKITIALSISSGTLTATNLQTTVSLRDYTVSGVQ